MNQPTHDEIALKAHSLWKDRGCPEGIDNEIWFEAERQLRGENPPGAETAGGFTRRAQTEAAAESRDDYHLSATTSEQQAIQAAVQKPGRGSQGRRSPIKGGSGQRGLG
jgi:hypothetical protein